MIKITELSCRVCLQEQDVMINIYDEVEDLQTNLCYLLETCGDLQIDANDVFPKYLCEDCTGELLISSSFREKCYKSKEVFKEILQQNKESVIKESDNLTDIVEYAAEDFSNIIEVTDVIIEECHTVEETEQEESFDKSLGQEMIKETQDFIITNEVSEPLQWESTNDVHANDIVIEDVYVTEDTTISQEDSCLEQSEAKQVELPKLPKQNKFVNDKIKRDLTFKCDICGVIYKQAINLQKHMQKTHTPLKSFTCDKCDHWFSLETEFNKHKITCDYVQTIVNEKDYNKNKFDYIVPQNVASNNDRKCVYCERDFPTPFALRMHLRTHTGERPFQCKYCDKAFKTQSALNVHSKRHLGQADFVCSVCNKTFYEQGNLSAHMRSHTGDRPHVCTVCKKTFTRVYLLQLHMRTHTGEKPYNCPHCDKSFRQTTDLRSHLTIHTGQKHYSCSLCTKSFIKRVHLMQHMQKHPVHQIEGVNEEEQALKAITTEDSVDLNIENSEVLYSFDDITASEDVILQSDVTG